MAKKSNDLNLQKINTIIGPGTVFEGDFTGKETTRIEGIIKGNIFSEGSIIVGSDGNIYGNVEAINVIVGGTIVGDIKSSGRIEVTSTGIIKGNIITNVLVIDESAVFQGSCNMVSEVKEVVEEKTQKNKSFFKKDSVKEVDAEEVDGKKVVEAKSEV